MAHVTSASNQFHESVGGSVSISGSNHGAQYAQHSPNLGSITKSAASGTSASFHATNFVADGSRDLATKAAQAAQTVDPDTGEITTSSRRSFQDARQNRYALHKAFREIEPTHRTAKCLWSVISSDKSVQVLLDQEHNRARYNNLHVCGRVWPCPFCSTKISERRAAELASAMTVAKSQGLNVALLTCTVPHVLQDGLKVLAGRLLKAWSRLVDNRAGKAIRADLGLVGTIRNIEATHGLHGWHPHFHCLVFYKNNVDLTEIESRWSAEWQRACVSSGLRRPSDEHGLTLQNGDAAAAYVSKWGLEHELTKSMHKVGRKHGRTPFDILRDYEKGIDQEENAALFREFVAAFHNVRQLYWSSGLKKLLAVEEVTDEEMATREDERPTTLICELNLIQWKAIRNYYRATLLMLAENNPAAIPDFLDSVVLNL